MKNVIRIVVLVLIVGAASAGTWYWQTHNTSADPSKLVLYGNVDIRQVEFY